MPEAASKICVKCGTDCAGKPRTKDSKGRYMCRPCADAVEQARAEPAPGEDDGAIPVEGIDASAIGSILAAESSVRAAPRVVVIDAAVVPGGDEACPACGAGMRAGAMKCKACGFDRRAGLEGGKGKVGTTGKCSGCGYDLKGIKASRCPECGKILPPSELAGRVGRREVYEADSRSTARNEYLRPLIMMGIGLGGTAIFVACGGHNVNPYWLFGLKGGSGVSAGGALIGYGLLWGVSTVATFIAYCLLCVMWIGFDAPHHLNFMRLAGVIAVANLSKLVFGLTGLPIISWVIPFSVYYGLLMQEMELDDWKEALVLTLLSRAIVFGAAFGIATLLN